MTTEEKQVMTPTREGCTMIVPEIIFIHPEPS